MTITHILQCPVTGADLLRVDAKRLRALNEKVASGGLAHLSGEPVRMRLEDALATPDGLIIYPVVDDIMVLLPSLAIAAQEHALLRARQQLAAEIGSVMRFYDEIGWQRGKHGSFQDAEKFEDLRPVSREYIHRCHLRVNRYIERPGRFLLDVGSGPIQYDEYLTYSEGYDVRICADVSFLALKEAKVKLGDRGAYVQCDITQLPFKRESVDGFVCLHTIYHVHASRQALAFQELERLLVPGRTGVVVYTWHHHCRAMRFLTAKVDVIESMKGILRSILPRRIVLFLKNAVNAGSEEGPPRDVSSGHSKKKGPVLYGYPHSYAWFQEHVASSGHWETLAWRSVSVPFLRRFVHPLLFGRFLLAVLYRGENAFPRFFGRFGQYPMMVCTKTGNRHRKGSETAEEEQIGQGRC